jgi:hypothetical protein
MRLLFACRRYAKGENRGKLAITSLDEGGSHEQSKLVCNYSDGLLADGWLGKCRVGRTALSEARRKHKEWRN